MAVLRFFFRTQFGERLADLREIKQWVVAESVVASGCGLNDAFGGAAESLSGVAVAGRSEHAYETRGALFGGNICQFAKNPGIVGVIVGVAFCHVRRLILQIGGGVASGMDPGFAAE